MIYECPNCQTPQEAGQTVCPHCHAQFDGPVPEDAVLPPGETAFPEAASPEVSASEAEPALTAEVAPAETIISAEATAPLLVEVPPPADSPTPPDAPPPPNSQPYLTPPSYSPPYMSASYEQPAYEQPEYALPPTQPFGGLSKVLLIAFPVVLVLVLGGVFYANSLNASGDAPPAPPPTVRASVPLPPAPVTSPTYLQGAGNTTDASEDPHTQKMIGHWEAKSGDYYVFNIGGTGSRGNPAKQQPEQTFLWGLVQNRVMLYMDKNETLRFNPGPDNDTIFLGGQTGNYVQFSRSKT